MAMTPSTGHEAAPIRTGNIRGGDALPRSQSLASELAASGRGPDGGVPGAIVPDIIAHVRNVGDVGGAFGSWLGRPGSRLWIEGFLLTAQAPATQAQFEYAAVLPDGQLSPWVPAGQYCGTRLQTLPLFGFCIRASAAARFDCVYSGRFVDGSEIGPMNAGTVCRTPSGAPLEALRITLQPRASSRDQRDLPREAAEVLPPGAGHYLAFVGPPGQYDAMGATQFRLLTTLGLREHHQLLDFGCGSLRAGRLLIPYLLPGHYHGIEPNTWLIEDAIAREIGQDQIGLKRPVFRANADFNSDGFGVRFDFILAQSVFSHAGRNLIETALAGFRRNLAEGGLVLATFVDARRSGVPENAGDGWVYPEVVAYREETIGRLIQEAGFVGMLLPWYHPRQSWYVMALTMEALPSSSKLVHLSGAVLRDPEFEKSS